MKWRELGSKSADSPVHRPTDHLLSLSFPPSSAFDHFQLPLVGSISKRQLPSGSSKMGLKDSLVTMMSDFVELRRNPEFRSKTELSSSAPGNDDALPLQEARYANRRHSLQITCGTQEKAHERCVHQRTFSVDGRHKKEASAEGQNNHSSSDSGSLKGIESAPSRAQMRRASEPLNMRFVGGSWGSGRKKQERRGAENERREGQEQDVETDAVPAATAKPRPLPERVAPSPPESPCCSPSPLCGRPFSGSKGAGSFFKWRDQQPIQEEEAEAELADGRRESLSGRKPYTTVVRL